MSKQTIVYLCVFITLSALGYWLYESNTSATNSSLDVKYNAAPQDADSRRWPRFRWDEEPIPVEQTIFKAGMMRVGPRGHVYILDNSGEGEVIKKIDLEGHLLLTVGEGEGGGPGEHQNIVDFDIGPGGNIWTLDASLGRMSIFDSTGAFIKLTSVDDTPFRIAVTDTHQAVIKPRTSARLFRYNSDGKRLGELEPVTGNPLQNAVIYTGRIYHVSDGLVLRIPMFVSHLLMYNSAGDFEWTRQLIDPREPPINAKNRDDLVTVDRDQLVATSHRAAFTDSTFHLIRYYRRPESRIIIDVYSIGTGAYKYSYELPRNVRDIAIDSGKLITMQDTSVTLWSNPKW